MIRRTVVFALALVFVASLAIPSGPVFAMSMSVEATSIATTDGSLSLLDRLDELTTDLWLWMGAAVLGTKSTTQEPVPVDSSDDLTSYGHTTDPNGLD